MKIYIDNYNPTHINKILNELDKYFIETSKYCQVFSDEGIFLINDSSIKKIIVQSDKVNKCNNYLDKYDLFLDDSTCIMETAHQLPSCHELIPVISFTYLQSNKSKIKMIVEGINNNNNENNMNTTNKYKNFSVKNFYFEMDSSKNMNDLMIKEEFNVFLSMLN